MTDFRLGSLICICLFYEYYFIYLKQGVGNKNAFEIGLIPKFTKEAKSKSNPIPATWPRGKANEKRNH